MDYKTLSFRGPFPNRMDPFAEAAHYFHQIHSGIISAVLQQIQSPLFDLGYVAKKEASLQIAQMRKPDVTVIDLYEPPRLSKLDYSTAAIASLVEPGVEIETNEIELQNIQILNLESGNVVTVMEIISPRNKTHIEEIISYQEKRQVQFLQRGINVVEVDLTRSFRRLIEHPLTNDFPYHIAILIPGERVRIIPMQLDEPFKKFALPLLESVMVIDLQAAYDDAYQTASIAVQIQNDTQYADSYLGSRSYLADRDYQAILTAVTQWHDELARLRTS